MRTTLRFWLVILCVVLTNTPNPGSSQRDVTDDTRRIQRLVESPSLILISTIDGVITAVDPKTGVEKWKLQEAPILESPVSVQQGFTFISNPQDGQLYLVVEGQLTKLPFTIPQLVVHSPCRSTDGILYAGSKKDVWISINPETGQKSSSASADDYCPANNPKGVFIGKTEYHIAMVDTNKQNRKWNATFIDYSSHLLPAEIHYPFQHFTSTSDGRMITVDASTGDILWKKEFKALIVNIYSLKSDGMHKLPSTAIGKETFEALIENVDKSQLTMNLLLRGGDDTSRVENQPRHLYPTLFVGESDTVGLYAIPAYVDEKTITIAPKYIGPPLLEGKMPIEGNNARFSQSGPIVRRPIVPAGPLSTSPSSTYKTVDGEYLLLGYHEPPREVSRELLPSGRESPHRHPMLPFLEHPNEWGSGRKWAQCVGEQCHRSDRGLISELPRSYPAEPEDGDDGWTLDYILQRLRRDFPAAFYSVILLLISLIFTVVWLCGRQNGMALMSPRSRRLTNDTSMSSISSTRSSALGTTEGRTYTSYETVETADEALEPGEDGRWMRIGKLYYDPKSILGRGCEGTVVFRGRFDGREVAVKRVVSDFIEIIDREVNHLRESDNHINVIRYFCSEADRTFRYIALELCECNLEDYVRDKELQSRMSVDELEMLRQASDGIAHLHSIKIVHRDVKPKNILISTDTTRTKARVLISDFGLCKKIKHGHNSISRMSGMAGTDGWMAPEVIDIGASITCAVDVFSLGCIFYYVMTEGDHPFGQTIRRQDNILRGFYNLQKLTDKKDYIGLTLIEAMVDAKASRRPSAIAVATHPIFWSKERQLQFLLDVSDRIEKEEDMSLPVQRLERQNFFVVGGNWRNLVSKPLQEDLQKYRTYKGGSVRDLLRALRNKKHHYRELPEELKLSLGSIPDEYLTYFTSKFPRLLMHAYVSMTVCADESNFATYYPPDLKAFYERLLAEDLERHPTKVSQQYLSMRHEPSGFQLSSVQHKYASASNILDQHHPNYPVPMSEADEASNWRNRSKASPSDAQPTVSASPSPPPPPVPSPSPPLPPYLPGSKAQERSPNPATSRAKKSARAKKKKVSPFSALAELDTELGEDGVEGADADVSPPTEGGDVREPGDS